MYIRTKLVSYNCLNAYLIISRNADRQNSYVEGIDLIYNQRKAEFLIISTERCNILNSIQYGTTCNCPFADESLLFDNNTTSCKNVSSVFVSCPQCTCFTVILTINDKDQPLGIQLQNNGES